MKYLRDAFRGAVVVAAVLFVSCQHSVMLETAAPSAEIAATPQGYTQSKIALGSDFPADIIIPDIDGMRETAFIVSPAAPAGVLALDITSQQLKISAQFPIFLAPPGTGIPNNLSIQSSSQALLLTSSHLILYNPSTASVASSVLLTESITIPEGLVNSDGSVAAATVKPNFPGGIAVIGNQIFVAMANYLKSDYPAVAQPGLVLQFTVDWNRNQVERNPSFFVTPYYNPTALTALGDQLFINQSGVIDIREGQGITQTDAAIGIWDTVQKKWLTQLLVGREGLSFHPLAMMPDAASGFVGSATANQIYQIDLVNHSWLRGPDQPIRFPTQTKQHDFISDISISADAKRLYVSSFNQSRVFLLNVTENSAVTMSDSFPIGQPAGTSADNPTGANTGAGPSSVRPGTPDIDFSGPDLFVLSGYPGEFFAITTRPKNQTSSITDITIHAPKQSLVIGETVPLTTSLSFANGIILKNITRTFEHPTTKQFNLVVWFSSPPKIALVDQSGVVTPQSAGTAIITAKVGNQTDHMLINVGEAPVASITPPAPAPSNPTETQCQGFIGAKVSFDPGDGAGFGSGELPDIILGPPKGEASGNMQGTDVVSLGRQGEIVVDMHPCEIVDAAGIDFIVFENPFWIGGVIGHPFAELGIVAVSEDGEHFTEFECAAANYPYTGCAGWNPVLSHPDNSISPFDVEQAGGDPFDLADIGVERARYIRIRDISNTGSGFDLDAIAVVNGKTNN